MSVISSKSLQRFKYYRADTNLLKDRQPDIRTDTGVVTSHTPCTYNTYLWKMKGVISEFFSCCSRYKKGFNWFFIVHHKKVISAIPHNMFLHLARILFVLCVIKCEMTALCISVCVCVVCLIWCYLSCVTCVCLVWRDSYMVFWNIRVCG